jgi:hypothetical protein
VKLWKSLSTTFLSTLRHPRLWLLQFFGNAAILLGFAGYLNIPDSYWWQLFFQVVILLVLLVAALLLHGGTLNYYSDVCDGKNARLEPAMKSALKHLPAFAISIVVLGTLLWLAFKLNHYQYELPGYLRSEMPAWMRRHISEPAMDNLYAGFVFLVFWVVVPGLILPLCLLCARIGFRAFLSPGSWWRAVRSLAFWIVLIVAALIGVYCVEKIAYWLLDPKTATLREEQVWLAFRLVVVYILMLFSWLWVCCMMARARSNPDPPAASQKAAA